MLGLLLCPAKSTLTNIICAKGGQHSDWTADYRLYSKERVDESVLFGRVRDSLIDNLAPDEPLVVAVDDTIAHKTGKKIYGSAWKRDPLGPPFQTNLIRAQRYLQFSASWPLDNGEARSVPIAFHHAPSPVKPPPNATPAQHDSYREALKQQNLNRLTLEQLKELRHETPSARQLIVTGDGSYTNKTILRGKPKESTTSDADAKTWF